MPCVFISCRFICHLYFYRIQSCFVLRWEFGLVYLLFGNMRTYFPVRRFSNDGIEYFPKRKEKQNQYLR